MENASMVLVLGTSGEAKSLEKGWSREMAPQKQRSDQCV